MTDDYAVDFHLRWRLILENVKFDGSTVCESDFGWPTGNWHCFKSDRRHNTVRAYHGTSSKT